jgi:integrase
MKTSNLPTEKAPAPKMRKVAENIYQYTGSRTTYYARFRHKGQRIITALGTRAHPCTSLPEAKRLLREKRNELDSTEHIATRKTFGQIIAEFERVMAGSEATLKYKRRYLKRLKSDFPLPLTTRISEVKKSDIIKFMALFKESTADHYNHVLTLVRDVFNYALADRAITASPVEGIKYRKRQETNKKLIPTWEEFEQIVKSVRSQVLADTARESADLIEFMGKAGLGQAECAGLRWQDINFASGQIVLIRKKTRAGFTIPLYPVVRPLLERMDSEREPDRDPEEKVFKVKEPKKALSSACTRLKLPQYSPRAFRRMFISRCLHDLGIDVQTIASWQGHKDGGQLILRTYARLNYKHQREMAKRLVSPEDPAEVVGAAKEESSVSGVALPA